MTSAVFTEVSCQDIKQVRQKRVNPSQLHKFGKKFAAAAKLVEEKWDCFSDEEKQSLKAIANKLIEPPHLSYRERIRGFFYMLFLLVRGQLDDLTFCVDSLSQLADNILNKVEQDDPEYKRVILDTLEEIKQNPEIGEIVNSGNICEKLRQLSDQAFTEF